MACRELVQVFFPTAVEVGGDHLCVGPRPGCPADVPDGLVIEVGPHAPVAVPLCEGPIAWTENEQVRFPIAVEVCVDHLCVWPRPGRAAVHDDMVIEVVSHDPVAVPLCEGPITWTANEQVRFPIAVEVCGDHLCVG